MLQKGSTLKTLEVFFKSPTKTHYLIDISRKIGLAHTSVKKNLSQLLNEGLIKETIQKKGRRKFPVYSANIDNKNFKRQKIVYNLSSLFQSGLIDFLEEKLAPNSIVVFGSYRRGEDTEDSDIDLFVETVEENIDVTKFGKKLNRKIQIHFKKEFTNYPKELKNNIINGIAVQGFLEGYK